MSCSSCCHHHSGTDENKSGYHRLHVDTAEATEIAAVEKKVRITHAQ